MSRPWAQPLTRDNLTLANFTFTFFEYSATQAAILNTLELGVMTACVGAGLVALLSYITSRRLVVGHQLVAFLALVVIPSVVLAVGLFIAYTRPPLLLYGTLWILFIAYLTKEMPVGYAQSDATFRAIPADLEDAALILGGGRLRVLRDITAPLAKSGIIAAWCFIFIGVIRELSASIILFTPSTKVMSAVIFDLKEEGQFGAIAVLGLVMLVMTFATVALVQHVLGRDFLGPAGVRNAYSGPGPSASGVATPDVGHEVFLECAVEIIRGPEATVATGAGVVNVLRPRVHDGLSAWVRREGHLLRGERFPYHRCELSRARAEAPHVVNHTPERLRRRVRLETRNLLPQNSTLSGMKGR